MKHISYIAGLTGLCLATLFCSCSNESKVKKFTEKFAENIEANNRPELRSAYPDLTDKDSLATITYTDEELILTPNENGKIFTVDFGKDIQMRVAINDEGELRILDSKRLFAYNDKKLKVAKQLGQFKDDLTDAENSKRINDEGFKVKVAYEFAARFKERVTISPFYSMSIADPYETASVTNGNDVEVKGSTYKVMCKEHSGNRYLDYTFPGKNIFPGREAQFPYRSTQNSCVDVDSGKIIWLLSDEEIFYTYYSPKGNEYDTYLSNK